MDGLVGTGYRIRRECGPPSDEGKKARGIHPEDSSPEVWSIIHGVSLRYAGTDYTDQARNAERAPSNVSLAESSISN